ncbi:MAG: DUF4175 family protein [Myxococcota bacterium]|nr:DUF4175 family protein [Myxococcota bacterium]
MTPPTTAWVRAIEALSVATRSHARRLLSWVSLILCLTALSSWLIAAQLGWSLIASSMIALAVALLVGGGLLSRQQFKALRIAAQDQQALSRLFRALQPETGTSVESAVEFSQSTLSGAPSDEVNAFKLMHVNETLKLLEPQAWTTQLQTWTSHLESRLKLGAGLALTIGLMTLSFATEGRSRVLTWLQGETQAILTEESLVTDILIVTKSPAYTKLPPRKVEGSDGTIEGLRGSLVELFVHALKEDFTPLIIPLGEDESSTQNPIVATPTEEGGFKFEFSLQTKFQYRFGLTDHDGLNIVESRMRQVLVKPDQAPNVTLESQAMRLEIRDQDSVTLPWKADDDFGIERIDMLIAAPGEKTPIRIRLDAPGATQKTERGTWTFTPKAHLSSGIESVELWVEAVDNDATTGGNIGQSRRLSITILSARRQHQKLLKEADKLHMALVDLLAIEWEEDLRSASSLNAQGRYIAAATSLSGELDAFTVALNEDALAKVGLRETFENVRDNLSVSLQERQDLIRRRGAQQGQISKKDQAIQLRARTTLENDIIYLDDLLSLQRIDDLRQTTDELLTQRDELQNLLQAYRENQDPAMKQELAERIDRLRQQMNQLLQEMAAIRKSLPGEYRNLEASSALQVEDQLSRINDAISEGDLEAAFQELDAISGMLEQMQRSLDQAEEDYGDERYDELRQEMDEAMSNLSEVESRQEELNRATEKLYEDAKERHFQEAQTTEASLKEKLLKEIRAALLSLDNATETQLLQSGHRQFGVTRENLLDMELAARESLLNQVADTFADATRSWLSFSRFAQARLSRFPQGEQTILKSVISDVDEHFEEIERLLEQLNPEIDFRNDPRNQAALNELEAEQKAIEEQAQKTREQLDALSSELPIFGEDASESWSKAQREMQDASGAFQRDKLNKGKVHGRRALEAIRSFKQGLEQAAQQGAGGKGPKIPLPFGARQSQGSGKGGKGFKPNSEDVVLPQGQESRRSIRDDILEAAKQEAPEGYEEAVRQYYEELIR